jgi:hypothetical protein
MTGSTTGEQGAFRYLQRRLNDRETVERSRDCVIASYWLATQ